MGVAFLLRVDYDWAKLRRLAKGSSDSNQNRRLPALAEICDNGSPGVAALVLAPECNVRDKLCASRRAVNTRGGNHAVELDARTIV